MSDDCIQVIQVTPPIILLHEAPEVQSSQRELDVSADLAGHVGIEPEPLEVDTQHLRQLSYAHLLQAVLETKHKSYECSHNESETE